MTTELCIITVAAIIAVTIIICEILDKFKDIFDYYDTKDNLREANYKISILNKELKNAEEEIAKRDYSIKR